MMAMDCGTPYMTNYIFKHRIEGKRSGNEDPNEVNIKSLIRHQYVKKFLKNMHQMKRVVDNEQCSLEAYGSPFV